MPKPVKPEKPGKTTSSRASGKEVTRRVETTTTETTTEMTQELTSEDTRELYKVARQKEKAGLELTAEERQVVRRERRKREEQLKKKARKEVSASKTEDESGASSSAAPPVNFNADLSNQNNITINNTGMEEMAKVMDKVLDFVKEQSSSKKEETTKVIERIVEVPVAVKEEKPKRKESSKGKSKVTTEKTTVTTETTTTDVLETVENLTKSMDAIRDKFDIEKIRQSHIQELGRKSRSTRFKAGLAARTVITKTTLIEWIEEASTPIWLLFWEVIYLYGTNMMHVFLMAFTLWIHDDLSDKEYFEGFATFSQLGTQADALVWFLTEYKPSIEYMIFMKNVDHLHTSVMTGDCEPGCTCFYVDPLTLADPRTLESMSRALMKEMGREKQWYQKNLSQSAPMHGGNPYGMPPYRGPPHGYY